MSADYRIVFQDNDKGAPAGKLADAEIHFERGILAGMKLAGFGVWERRAGGLNLTVPARQYTVNGERRSYALLRPTTDASAQDTMREIILSAWRARIEARDQGETEEANSRIVAGRVVTNEPRRYDNPDDAAAAARAGQPIVISDLIPKRTPTPQAPALAGMTPAGFTPDELRAMPPASGREVDAMRATFGADVTPRKTPGQLIMF